MRHVRTLFLAAAAVAAAALPAAAQGNTAVGRWVVSFYVDNAPNMPGPVNQTICVLPNGTWYGLTFPNWGGHWFQKGANGAGNGDHVRFTGNYAGGGGNDAAEVDFVNVNLMTGPWSEWRDPNAGGFLNWTRVTMARQGGCANTAPHMAAPAEAAREKGDPAGPR